MPWEVRELWQRLLVYKVCMVVVPTAMRRPPVLPSRRHPSPGHVTRGIRIGVWCPWGQGGCVCAELHQRRTWWRFSSRGRVPCRSGYHGCDRLLLGWTPQEPVTRPLPRPGPGLRQAGRSRGRSDNRNNSQPLIAGRTQSGYCNPGAAPQLQEEPDIETEPLKSVGAWGATGL